MSPAYAFVLSLILVVGMIWADATAAAIVFGIAAVLLLLGRHWVVAAYRHFYRVWWGNFFDE